MKKKSFIYSDLSKKQLENLKEFYVKKKVESMSHQELKQYVQEIISHQLNESTKPCNLVNLIDRLKE